jgi:membrane protease YdiL (CAAX protease family)
MATLNPPAVSVSSPGIKPLPLGPAVLFFAIPSLAVTMAYYWGIPALAELGLPEYQAFLVATGAPLFGLLVAALVAHSLEGRLLTWAAFSNRFRLRRMAGKDWLWALGGFLFTTLGFGLMILSDSLASRGIIPLPASLPASLHPSLRVGGVSAYRELMGEGAIGNWGVIALILWTLFSNVIGEELYFRGYLLPRQELAHGRRAWLIHFVLWTLFHAFIYWRWLYVLAITLPVTYITYRRQNTWQGIFIHGLHNIISMAPLVLIIFEILR